MDEDLEALALSVRADKEAFARDVLEMRGTLTGALTEGAEAAGRGIEQALRRAARSGRLEFEDLARVAGRALGEIAGAALQMQGGLGSALSGAGVGLLGLAGRATGGPVSPGQAYVVGERGPELFVPTASGRVETGAPARGPVNVSVHVAAPREAGSAFMAQTGRQVALGVRRALERAGR
ncbi:tail tape measure protein [Sandaracinobacter sp. RS1-74]|uniref:tail tape measure protein n=1 Tax=Sandaracinobacteroides sayramensis TaxID=2913411 RepID=UPI001EDB57DC|nr:tail tape measure protein [Sandaracinobacteroides sayramensis]MCG2839756.1 tail tape measure protein [Sandaracinobacteroides sayramensis]